MAETKAEKARRYLAEGRVSIVERRKDDSLVVAYVRGETGELHSCGYDGTRRQWRCTCPAYSKSRSHPDCSHLLALKLVVAVGGSDRQGVIV